MKKLFENWNKYLDEKMEVLSETSAEQRQRDARRASLGDAKEAMMDAYIEKKSGLDQGDFSRAHPDKWRQLSDALPDEYKAIDDGLSDEAFKQAVLEVLQHILP